MGACYSKNTAGTGTSSESKRPNHKHKDSYGSGKGNAEDLKNNDKHLEKPALMNDTSNDAESRLSILDAVAGHANEKLVNSSVVPSDSGIESINTVVDDVGESAQLKQTDKTPEHPSCDTRQRSGDHDVILDSRQNEGCVITSHDTQNSKDSSTCSKIYAEHEEMSAKNGTIATINTLTNGSHGDINDFKCKIKLRSTDSSNKDGSVGLVSECTVTKSDILHMSMPSLKCYTNLQTNNSNERSASYKAPLAAFDSIEGNLNESSIHFNGKRQSLLSEILDLTESLCKCDFYSTENCSRDHGINGAVTGLRHNGHNSEIGASGQFEKVSDRLNQILPYKCKPLSGSSSASASQMSSTPSKKLTSLPKNVSFAAHERSTETASGASHNHHLDSDLFILSSDKYSHRTASEIIFPNKQKGRFHVTTFSFLISVLELSRRLCGPGLVN